MAKIKKNKINPNQKMLNWQNFRKFEERNTNKYIFKNISKETFYFEKPSLDGKLEIIPNSTWKGDDSFMTLVKNNKAEIVETLFKKEEEIIKEEVKTDMKELILDQPPKITVEGEINTIIKNNNLDENLEETENDLQEQSLNKKKKKNKKLITEDPEGSIEIIKD